MHPLFFGPPDEPVFGLYEAPQGTPRDRAIVICPSFGAEYLPAYTSLKRLAHQLCAEGFPVMRFDWYGTGDSAGEAGAGDPARWCADLEAALDELRALAGVDALAVVALRLGATIAARVGSGRRDVAKMVLWEPLLDGASWVAEQRAQLQGYLSWVLPRPLEAIRSGADRIEAPESLTRLDLLTLQRPPAPEVLLLGRREEEGRARLAAHLESLGARVERKTVEAWPVWRKAYEREDALVHPGTLAAIGAWLSGGSAGAP